MLKGTGVVLGGLAVPGLLEACLSSSSSSSSGSIKIGYVSPITGPAAGFGEPDAYVLSLAKKAFQNGINIGGGQYSHECRPPLWRQQPPAAAPRAPAPLPP